MTKELSWFLFKIIMSILPYFALAIIGALVVAVLTRIIILLVDGAGYEDSSYKKQTNKRFALVRFDKGAYGEYLIYKNLRKYEEGSSRFLFNVYVPKENGETGEIDVIMLCKKGIFVFESKNLSGWIFGDEYSREWTQTLQSGKKNRFTNPVSQNKGHIKYLKNYLGAEYPLYSVITFSDRCELKKISISSDNTVVIHRKDVEKTVEEIVRRSEAVIDENTLIELYNKLYPLTQVTKAEKQAHIKAIEEKKNSNVCPRCGSPLVLRTAKNGANKGGQFYGCSSFPKCIYTKNI